MQLRDAAHALFLIADKTASYAGDDCKNSSPEDAKIHEIHWLAMHGIEVENDRLRERLKDLEAEVTRAKKERQALEKRI